MQCQARTYLYGPRCSRKARVNGYCFQHEAPTGDFLKWQTEANEADEAATRKDTTMNGPEDGVRNTPFGVRHGDPSLHTPDIGQRVVPLRYRDGRPMTQDGQQLYGGAEYYCRTCERTDNFTLESTNLEDILAAHDPKEDEVDA